MDQTVQWSEPVSNESWPIKGTIGSHTINLKVEVLPSFTNRSGLMLEFPQSIRNVVYELILCAVGFVRQIFIEINRWWRHWSLTHGQPSVPATILVHGHNSCLRTTRNSFFLYLNERFSCFRRFTASSAIPSADVVTHIENKRSSIWQLCRHWWHRELS